MVKNTGSQNCNNLYYFTQLPMSFYILNPRVNEVKIKLKNTNLCTFCKILDESIEQLFFDCPVTQSVILYFEP